MSYVITQALYEKLEKMARKESIFDNYVEGVYLSDHCSGNEHDAFQLGRDEGEIEIARMVVGSVVPIDD